MISLPSCRKTISRRSAPPRAEPVLQLQATTVFAFHCKDGVIITGDHRATAESIIFSDKTEKILELDSHSLMAIAGVPATAFEMARTLQTSFEFYRRSQLQQMSLKRRYGRCRDCCATTCRRRCRGLGSCSRFLRGWKSMIQTASRRFSFTIRWGRSSKRQPVAVRFRLRQHQTSCTFSNAGAILPPAEMSVEQAVTTATRF